MKATPASIAKQVKPLHVEARKVSWNESLKTGSRIDAATRIALLKLGTK